jgi:hypothetical protein
MRIVALDTLKRALGLDLEDTSEDEALTELEDRVAEWVEGQTKRRFSAPLSTVEYQYGSGTRDLFLKGHLDVGEAEPVIAVAVRFPGGDWEEEEDFELREDRLVRTDGWVWSRGGEYRITYLNGYTLAPSDVQALVIEMVAGQYGADAASAAGELGVTSEKIGDYSYTLGETAVAGATGGGTISDTGFATLNRWKRLLV